MVEFCGHDKHAVSLFFRGLLSLDEFDIVALADLYSKASVVDPLFSAHHHVHIQPILVYHL